MQILPYINHSSHHGIKVSQLLWLKVFLSEDVRHSKALVHTQNTEEVIHETILQEVHIILDCLIENHTISN